MRIPSTPRGRLVPLLGLAGTIGVAIALLPGHRGWFDVGVYHGAVNHWLAGGQLYDYVRPGTGYGFTYPPFAAVCMLPMALLDWHTTIAVNAAVTAVAAAAVLVVLVDPIARREGWHRGFTFALVACLFAMLGPVRDTVSFGQINLVLLALVYADLRLLERGHRLAGIGSGIAAAIKLTPAIFIGYLVVTGRWRSAAVATGTAATATLGTALVAPDATWTYFGESVWDTGRIGTLEYVSNQSLLGLVARLAADQPNRIIWIVLVAGVLAVWVHRVRVAALRGDDRTGFALTGIVACLVSPVTWVHHLVWLVPGLVVLVDSALPRRATDPRVRRRRWTAAGAYLLLCGSVVWLWSADHSGLVGFVGSNSYVLLALGMLVFLPPGRALPPLGDAIGARRPLSRSRLRAVMPAPPEGSDRR